MNVSITDSLAGYVRKKVRSGRYNSASEVVREALRRMEEDDRKAIRLARPGAEEIIADLTAEQVDAIRTRVKAGLASLDRGDYVEYEGRQGILQLADEVRARGRRILAKKLSRKSAGSARRAAR